MNETLKEELDKVRSTVDRILKFDNFPDSVEPVLLRDAVRAYPLRGGKRLRPALTLWSCGAAGGRPELAEYAAVAVEIYHNWTLVHDDIIDCDETRRGHETCHAKLRRESVEKFKLDELAAAQYGNSMAILAGDVQQGWAKNMLLRTSELGVNPKTVLALAGEMESGLNRGLISGEALDVEFEFRSDVPDREAVKRMIHGKTGALLSYCATAGSMIALDTDSFDNSVVKALAAYADHLGYAFQLCDDLLGVYGDADKFGKPLCSDFREGKPTILYIDAMERLDENGRRQLHSMMHLPEYGHETIMKLRKLLDDCGARKAVSREAERSSDAALENLALVPAGKYRDLLEELSRYLLQRRV